MAKNLYYAITKTSRVILAVHLRNLIKRSGLNEKTFKEACLKSQPEISYSCIEEVLCGRSNPQLATLDGISHVLNKNGIWMTSSELLEGATFHRDDENMHLLPLMVQAIKAFERRTGSPLRVGTRTSDFTANVIARFEERDEANVRAKSSGRGPVLVSASQYETLFWAVEDIPNQLGNWRALQKHLKKNA